MNYLEYQHKLVKKDGQTYRVMGHDSEKLFCEPEPAGGVFVSVAIHPDELEVVDE